MCGLNRRAKVLHKTVYLCVVLYKKILSAHFWEWVVYGIVEENPKTFFEAVKKIV